MAANVTATAGDAGWGQAFLSGIGYYRLSVRRRKILACVFAGSLVVHAVGLLAFGGWVVMRSKKEEVAIFTTPPPSRTYEPRKLEHRVKVQKRQRSSSRPSMVPRMVSMKVADLALPEIKVDPKIIHTTFQPKFKAVSGKGLGAGLGTGYGTHGFGAGVSSVNFFGIRARGEIIAVLVDVSVSMVEEERGGVPGYMRVKQRVEQVIDALSEATLFNVIAFADAARTWKDEMVVANPGNKKDAKLFLRPFNTQGNWGLTHGNVKASTVGVPALGGTTRLDLALTAAFRQGADTILIISDGLPRVKKGHTKERLEAFRRQQEQWAQANAARMAAYQESLAAWQRSEAGAQYVEEKVWVPPRPAVPERIIPARPPSKGPPKEGQAPDRGSPRRVIPAQPARPGYFKVVRRRVGGGGGRARPRAPQPPKMPGPGWWTLSDFVRHFEILYEHSYKKRGKKPPMVHCIGYQIDEEGSAFLRDFSAHYRGKYRRVRTLR